MSDRYRAAPGGLRLRRRRNPLARIVFYGLALTLAAQVGLILFDAPPQPPVAVTQPEARREAQIPSAPQRERIAVLDTRTPLGPPATGFSAVAPLSAEFRRVSPPPGLPPATEAARAPAEAAEATGIAPEGLVENPEQRMMAVPLPQPRPADLKLPAIAEAPRPSVARPARRARAAAAQAAAEDNRSFFEKLFGVQRPSGPALAYAAPEDDVVDRGRGRRLSPVAPTAPTSVAGTAVYDISAKTVYMPNGDRLEAHSGLGEMMDDVRYAHVRMKGVTPPHTYTLTEREALFHGVRAIRLNPIGGSGAIHGRAGLLAHTYLLGPRGDSNGCISFKDYDKFLQAYLRGEVKRLVVVAGNG